VDSFEIKWAFWGVVALAALVLLVVVLRGQQPPGPLDCASRVATDTVLDLLQKNSHWGDSTFEVDKIHKTSADDPAATSIECAATAWVENHGVPFKSSDITYTVERNEKGEIYVTVAGLAKLNSFP
jgi:hypothetical protein